MSNDGKLFNTCGCCSGPENVTPVSIENRPGLSPLVYRAGTHGQFKAAMQKDLSRWKALDRLRVRDDNDFSMALLDAWAVAADVLTFYQERIANEGYLPTAAERLSVLQMARMIGYELNPGAAADTYLAFTLADSPIAPITAALLSKSEPAPVVIDKGIRVQSVPGQDELPQMLETIEEIEAKVAWNALKPRLSKLIYPKKGDTTIYLKGTSTNLSEGDHLLIIGEEREEDPGNENWDFRKVKAIETVPPPIPSADPGAGYTKVTLNRELGSVIPYGEPTKKDPEVYALRQQASLFGHNAPDCRLFHEKIRTGFSIPVGDDEWPDFTIRQISPTADTVCLDLVYPKIQPGSWVVLSSRNYQEVYEVLQTAEMSQKKFSLTSKVTRLKLKGENLESRYDNRVRETIVYAQSEKIEIAETPITTPVSGNEIVLDSVIDGMEEGRKLIITGKRIRARIAQTDSLPTLVSIDDPALERPLQPGDELVVMEPPTEIEDNPGAKKKKWHLKGYLKQGEKNMEIDGYVTTQNNEIAYTSAGKEDESVSEIIVLSSPGAEDDFHTKLVLTESLKNIYDRTTVTISGNVARATHGETVTEVLGSGDASQVFQRFTLRQSPLTYVSASTPSGVESTLEVRVNDLLWKEVPSFYGHGPGERIYITRMDNDTNTTVWFGDGITGARVPTGQENITATFRKGIGRGGMLKAGQLSLLMTQPYGVKEAINPLAPTGADDPETLELARQNSPLTVLTLDRVVSLRDFEDFARAFTGIEKAQATWLWNEETKLVHITVSGVNGEAVEVSSKTYENLKNAIKKSSNSKQPFIIDSYKALYFKIEAGILTHSDYITEKVWAEVTAVLEETFSFKNRDFGQPVTKSEVVAVIQSVKGVEAVDLEKLNRVEVKENGEAVIIEELEQEGEEGKPNAYLPARRAGWEKEAPRPYPAELLMLTPQGVTLTEK